MISIRITDYNGDFDTLREVKLIGPYDSEQDRDRDLERLSSDEEMYGIYELEASDLSDGEYVYAPSRFASVSSIDDFEEALYS